jgi:hypothetical protein
MPTQAEINWLRKFWKIAKIPLSIFSRVISLITMGMTIFLIIIALTCLILYVLLRPQIQFVIGLPETAIAEAKKLSDQLWDYVCDNLPLC